MKVTIVGAGIIGLSTAYYLQKAGCEVSVIDAGNGIDNCSFGNMGYISPSHYTPLASPGIIAEGLKYMFRKSSPFYLQPSFDWGRIKWAYQFYKSCNGDRSKKLSKPLLELLLYSKELYIDLAKNLCNTFQYSNIGCLMLCKSPKAFEHEKHLAEEASKLNLEVNILSKAEAQALEPQVEMDIAGAVHFLDDAYLQPGELMQTLQDFLQKNGVQFFWNQRVQDIALSEKKVRKLRTQNREFDVENLVLANGSWLPHLTKKLGKSLLLEAGKGYSYTYESMETNLNYPSILVDGRCALSPWRNSLRIGGTMEISGLHSKLKRERMDGIYKSVKAFYPGLKITTPEVAKIWSGLRPLSPDGLPYIGKLDGLSNVVVAGGHAMIGISMATGTGKIVADMLCEQTPSIAVEAFRVGRF